MELLLCESIIELMNYIIIMLNQPIDLSKLLINTDKMQLLPNNKKSFYRVEVNDLNDPQSKCRESKDQGSQVFVEHKPKIKSSRLF